MLIQLSSNTRIQLEHQIHFIVKICSHKQTSTDRLTLSSPNFIVSKSTIFYIYSNAEYMHNILAKLLSLFVLLTGLNIETSKKHFSHTCKAPLLQLYEKKVLKLEINNLAANKRTQNYLHVQYIC